MSRAASKLAINRLLDRKPLDGAAIDRFIERHGAPIIEGSRATFLWRGHADEVSVRHRVVGLPDPLRLRHVKDTDLWYVSTDIPDQCGAITMPIARSMPSARIAAIACGMNGSECFIPR